MKKIQFFLVIVIFHLSSYNGFSQWVWSKQVSATNDVIPAAIESDNSCNVYVFGDYKSAISIGTKTFPYGGVKDIVLIKYNSIGDTLWVRTVNPTTKIAARAMTLDASGNVYITGGFVGTANFHGTVINAVGGSEDIYLAKYDPNGNLIFAKNVTWDGGVTRSSGIVVDENDSIAMVGFFNNNAVFGTNPGDTLYWSGVTNNFFAKFDNNGNFGYAKKFEGTDPDTRFNAITVAGSEGYYIGGTFLGTIYLPSPVTSNGNSRDILLLKVNKTGVVQWYKDIGNTQDDRCYDVISDNSGNAYITGEFFLTVNFGGQSVTSNGSYDFYIAKYNLSGNLLNLTSNGSIIIDESLGITTNNNQVQIAGYIKDTLFFAGDTVLTSGYDIESTVIGFYDMDLNEIAAYGTIGGINRATKITICNNETYVAGIFRGATIEFPGDGTLTNTLLNKRDMWVAKANPAIGLQFDVASPLCFGENNGTIDLTVLGNYSPYSYNWTTSDGSGLNPTDEDQTGLTSGTYCVTVTYFGTLQKSRCVTIYDPELIVIDSTRIDTIQTCFGDNSGKIQVWASGGSGNLTYTLNPGGISNDTGEFIDLTANIYVVNIADTNSCQIASSNLDVTEPSEIVIDSLKHTDLTSSGAGDGTITVFASGGTAPLTYTLNPGSIQNLTGEFTGLENGSYTVDISDANTCGPVTTEEIHIGTVDINYILQTQDFVLYPNPSNGQIHMVLKNHFSENITIKINNVNGRVIYINEIPNNGSGVISETIDLNGYSKGIYFVKIYGERLVLIEKFILK